MGPRQTTAQEQQRRRLVMEEFFRAYRTAREANRVFAEPGKASAHSSRRIPACVAALGLAWPCTAQEVRQAFRARAKTVHPDAGGSSEAFQALYRAYQEALALVK